MRHPPVKQRYLIRQSIETRCLRYLQMVYENRSVKFSAQTTAIQQASNLVAILSGWRYPY